MPGALRTVTDSNDPFADFMKPPKGETESDRTTRLAREAEEQRISNAIDEEINAARAALKKEKVVKVLLLGQSESGKSTALKNFRIAYDQAQWLREKASWRAVVQLNLIRSIGIILDALQSESTDEPISPTNLSRYSNDDTEYDDITGSRKPLPRSSTPTSEFLLRPRSSARNTYEGENRIPLTDKHGNLRLRLAPLNSVEADLKRVLGVGTEEVRSMDQDGGDARDNVAFPSESLSRPSTPPKRREEIFVRPWLWKEALQTGLHGSAATRNGERIPGLNADSKFEETGLQQASRVIANCKDAMKMLWNDETVRRILAKRNIRIEESAGFFLDDLDRIATPGYDPSDDDVVRCRLRTVGVQEYRLVFEPNARVNSELDWIIYDVGGSRTVRRAWIPYFDNVNAIIFLAPISAFDEGLLEDSTVNRLQDTISIWKAITSSKLLSRTTLVCFLNKCDLLRKKLKAGTRFRDYVPTYGDDTPNDTASVVRFMKNRFKEIVIKNTQDEKRMVYIYPTSCTDTKATAETLKTVRDSILRNHLQAAGLF